WPFTQGVYTSPRQVPHDPPPPSSPPPSGVPVAPECPLPQEDASVASASAAIATRTEPAIGASYPTAAILVERPAVVENRAMAGRRVDEELRRIAEEGFVILRGLLDAGELRALREALEPLERERPMGRNNFEGARSQRVYSLAARDPAFMRLAEHP